MISFIVSVYDRPENLAGLVPQLKLQFKHLETIICDNFGMVPDPEGMFGARLLGTGEMGALDPYDSANIAAREARGEWLCFPSDDSLYVADFSGIMLNMAKLTGAGLIYCDCVYKQGSIAGNWPAYSVLDVSPRMGRIDKTCFILKRELFQGFPPHPRNYRDGALIEELVRSGVKHAKAPGVLCVHQ